MGGKHSFGGKTSTSSALAPKEALKVAKNSLKELKC